MRIRQSYCCPRPFIVAAVTVVFVVVVLLATPCESFASSVMTKSPMPTTTTDDHLSVPVVVPPNDDVLPLSKNQKMLDEGPRFPRTWIPIGSIMELNPDRPTRFTFLNQNYISFKKDNSNNDWVVMDDACPHRLAPLSEGRIDTCSTTGERRVMCSYHGWTFDTYGQCQDIPQVTERVQAAAMTDPRCHVKSYSTVVLNGIIWSWLWKEDALEEATKNPWILPEHMMSQVQTIVSTYTRDLPYGWDTLSENLMDPSHIPFVRFIICLSFWCSFSFFCIVLYHHQLVVKFRSWRSGRYPVACPFLCVLCLVVVVMSVGVLTWWTKRLVGLVWFSISLSLFLSVSTRYRPITDCKEPEMMPLPSTCP